MKIATFTDGEGTRIGVIEGSDIIDVTVVAEGLPEDMTALLALGSEGLERIGETVSDAPRLTLDGVRLEAPVPRPGKFLAVGLNYAVTFARSADPRPNFRAVSRR